MSTKEAKVEAKLTAKWISESDNPVTVTKSQYMMDGSTALQITDKTGAPLMTASVWLEVRPNYGCVWIKNWSENEGILEALESAGVVKRTGRTTKTGFTTAYEAELLF